MDVNEFRADLLEEVHLNATMNGTCLLYTSDAADEL